MMATAADYKRGYYESTIRIPLGRRIWLVCPHCGDIVEADDYFSPGKIHIWGPTSGITRDGWPWMSSGPCSFYAIYIRFHNGKKARAFARERKPKDENYRKQKTVMLQGEDDAQ